MYASNEDEDWVYLYDTPPVNTVNIFILFILNRIYISKISQGAMNLVDYERLSSSSSSKSDRSVSLSSIFSTE
jgi:hypothetical protein